MNPKVDVFLNKTKKWQAEMIKLRKLILACGLNEDWKWGKPCYTLNGKNVVLLIPFKERCALMLFKGALLKDTHNILHQPSENTQGMRQINFTNLTQIIDLALVLKSYLSQAVAVEKSGLKVDFKSTSDFTIPEELQTKLDELPDLKAAFDALTPGRQRAYILYFAGAKQVKTRELRIEKCIPQILSGKGLND